MDAILPMAGLRQDEVRRDMPETERDDGPGKQTCAERPGTRIVDIEDPVPNSLGTSLD